MKRPREALLKSLSLLQISYLDLYLIHWPALARKPSSSPIHKQLRLEAWNILNETKREGLVRNIGVSNFTPDHIQELRDETEYGINGVYIQMEIHPWYWRDAVKIQTCFEEQNLTMVGYALLAEGLLLGSDSPDLFSRMAERLGLTSVQLVLAWALAKKWVILVKSVDEYHLK
jgi:diketogulonate reductase-like aldo/keto reductase